MSDIGHELCSSCRRKTSDFYTTDPITGFESEVVYKQRVVLCSACYERIAARFTGHRYGRGGQQGRQKIPGGFVTRRSPELVDGQYNGDSNNLFGEELDNEGTV